MITSTRHRPPTWREMQADTDPWAERLQFKFFREAPAWQKLEIAGDLTRGATGLVVAELERRYPEAPPAEIRRRLSDMLLGAELAARVYGPLVTNQPAKGHLAEDQPTGDHGRDT